ncbi:MAG: hypothetical protein APF84_02140 [Gracilibacter sp. BRH_c7a]|nr:MAG: hypothetical protein APF84_02140 [Gracilibacter sp. BRH_c7a]
MLEFRIKDDRQPDQNIKNLIFDNVLIASEIGVYSILDKAAGTTINLKDYLLDSIEQIWIWLTNLKEHGFISINKEESIITLNK